MSALLTLFGGGSPAPTEHPLAQYVATGGYLLDTSSNLLEVFTDLSGESAASSNLDPVGAWKNLADGALVAAYNSALKWRLLNAGGVTRFELGGFAAGLKGGFPITIAIPSSYYMLAVYKFTSSGFGLNPIGAAQILTSDNGGGSGEGNWQFASYDSPGAGRFAVTEGGFWGGGTLGAANGSPVMDSGNAGWVESFRDAGTNNVEGSSTIGGTPAASTGANPSKTMSSQVFHIGAKDFSNVGYPFELAFFLYTPSLPDAGGRAAIRDHVMTQFAGGW